MELGLDEVDRCILRFLQDDARISFAEIARQLKIGQTTVRYRVERLRRNGIIFKFATLLNPEKVGFPITSIIMLKVEPSQLKITSKQLVSSSETHHVFQTTGEHDFIVMVHARNMAHLNEIVKKVKMLPGAKDVSFSVITALAKIEARFNL